jgi:hypothetical protein
MKREDDGCMEGEDSGCCELCGRDQPLTKHHLIPKAVHGRKRYIKQYGKDEMRNRGVMACKLCHDGIHDLFTEKQLAEGFTSKESLLKNDRVQKHLAWVRKQK